MTLAARAPVRVDARLDAPLSRWLWLVKWVLVIPHLVVLTFLWAAFAVVTVVAFVAILVAGRYPRTIFDFNLGVLRWSWRVGYYASARSAPTATRRSPWVRNRTTRPPGHRLSRTPLPRAGAGEVVAAGHPALPGARLPRSAAAATWRPRSGAGLGGGLIGLLVLFAVVILLFTGRYPRGLFDLVLGLDRWVLRVAAYVALMTDSYPPFRLDLGGADPATLVVGEPSPEQPPATGGSRRAGTPPVDGGPRGGPRHRVGARARRPGLARWRHRPARGRHPGPRCGGLHRNSRAALHRRGLRARRRPAAAAPSGGRRGSARRGRRGARPGDRDLPLGGVRRDRSERRRPDLPRPRRAQRSHAATSATEPSTSTRPTAGGPPSTRPGQEPFWVATASGTGGQELLWAPVAGDWTLVVMNADGSRPVVADLSFGATAPGLSAVWAGLFGLGGAALVLGSLIVALTLWSASGRRR